MSNAWTVPGINVIFARLNTTLMRKYLLAAVLALLAGSMSRAQFYTYGDDPGSLRWYRVNTDHYSIIYPRGLDSLSRVYARLLEKVRPLEEGSTGYFPGGKKRTPVILHAYNAVSNGAVTWAPRRMDLYTLPSAYDTEPLPWAENLALHESRHLAQMQLGCDFKVLKVIFGDLVPGAVSAVYPGQHLLEGDAVVAETALSKAGRGRSGDFLNYYMPAFDNGDYKNWYRWRYGSFHQFVPNHYALGYMTVAGVRTLYDSPLFMKDYFQGVRKRPLRFSHMRKDIAAAAGKPFNEAFADIQKSFHDAWESEAASRGPFIQSEKLTLSGKFHTEYKGLTVAPEGLVAVKTSFTDSPELVLISGGTEKVLKAFPANAGDLRYSPSDGRIYWSETVPDVRWGLKMTSRIRFTELSRPGFKTLTRRGRLYNPAPSPDGRTVAAVDFPIEGGSALVFIDAEDGKEIRRFPAPDSLQLAEAAWMGDKVAVTGVSACGTGLYLWSPDGTLTDLIPPMPVTIKDLHTSSGGVYFTSDRTGVNEIYSCSDDHLSQLTSTKYGASDPALASDGLYFTSVTTDGRHVYKTGTYEAKKLSFSEIHRYAVADKLSSQEAALVTEEPSANVSEPKRYRKLPNIPHFHSWAPIAMGFDPTDKTDFDYMYDNAGLGVIGFFQNLLGTASGSVSYGYLKDGRGDFRHSGRLDMVYSGLFPVFSISAAVNSRAAMQYYRHVIQTPVGNANRLYVRYTDRPLADITLQVSVPLNFSSGGWLKGLTPRVKYRFTNDLYDKSEVLYEYQPNAVFDKFKGIEKHSNEYMRLLTLSLSGYAVKPLGHSSQYPKLGIGGELGYRVRASMSDMYSAGAFAYLYGYLPGFSQSHGIRLSALGQHLFTKGVIYHENYIKDYPRGFSDSDISPYLAAYCPNRLKLTADYALPLYLGDLSFLSPLAYITHFVFTPHVDCSILSFDKALGGGTSSLMSVGANLTAKLSNIAWVPFDFEVGVEFDYNCGNSYSFFRRAGAPISRTYIGPVFSASF